MKKALRTFLHLILALLVMAAIGLAAYVVIQFAWTAIKFVGVILLGIIFLIFLMCAT